MNSLPVDGFSGSLQVGKVPTNPFERERPSSHSGSTAVNFTPAKDYDLSFDDLLQQLRNQHELELQDLRLECSVFLSSQEQSGGSSTAPHWMAVKPSTKVIDDTHVSIRSNASSDVRPHPSEAYTLDTHRTRTWRKPSVKSKNSTGRRHSRDITAHDFRAALTRLCELPDSVETTDINFTLWSEWVGNLHHARSNLSAGVKFEKLVPTKSSTQGYKQTSMNTTVARRAASIHLRMAVSGLLHSLHSMKVRRTFIHPSSKTRAAWDSLGLVVLAFDLFWIPMQVFKPKETAFIEAVEMITMLYWTLDILLSFCSGYYEHNGHLVMKFRKIVSRYVRGWFFLDLTIVGIDWILFAFKGQMNSSVQSVGIARIVKVMRALRIMRTLRLLRVIKLREILYAIQERIDSEYMMIMLSMLQNLTCLTVLNHYAACLWFWMGTLETDLATTPWAYKYKVDEEKFFTKYLVSLRWTLVQFTPGGTDMQPQNNIERLFSCGLLLVAVIVGSTIISSITAAMTRLRNLKGNQLAQFFMLRKFLNQNQISRDLSTRLTRYIRLTVELQRMRIGRSKVELLSLLSGPLDVELQTELLSPTMVNHAFFQGYLAMSHAAISQICYIATTSKPYSKGDAIFNVSSLCREMLFCQRGTMYYRRMKRVRGVPPRSVVDLGDWSCEAALWIDNWIHLGTMRALIESEALAVSSEKFREITTSFHDVFQFTKAHAVSFLREVFDEIAKYGHTWDIPRRLMTPSEEISPIGEHLLSDREIKKQEVLAEDIIIDSSESEYDTDEEDDGHNHSTPHPFRLGSLQASAESSNGGMRTPDSKGAKTMTI